MAILQGEIYWVYARDLDIQGSEQKNNRPYVIVSQSKVNALGQNVVGVPFTTQLHAGGGHRVQVPLEMMVPNASWPEFWSDGVTPRRKLETSMALVDHIRVLDLRRLVMPKMGQLSTTAVVGLELALHKVFESPRHNFIPPMRPKIIN